MKLIQQSAEVLSLHPYEDMLRICVLAGRTCYKSSRDNNIAQDEKFIRNIIRSGHESVLEHASITVRLITSRTVTHQLVRHRLASYSQESQRYVNYSKDKFDNEVTFILPKDEGILPILKHSCITAEQSYFNLLECGAKPEVARSILPNCTKTELVMTANLREWRHILKIRTAKDVQPETRELMIEVLNKFKESYPIFFEDIEVHE